MRLLIVLSIVGTLFACTRGQQDVQVELPEGGKVALSPKDTLRYNNVAEPTSLDWQKYDGRLQDNLMEGLIQFDFADGKIGLQPALATKWEASEKQRKWKITTRKDVVWSDGQPFTAQQVIDGWQRLLSPKLASPYAYWMFVIKNAKAFHSGKVDFTNVGIKLTGENEITVELEKPLVFFPYLLTNACTYPARLDVIAKHGDKWTEAGKMVSLGPYVLRGWQHDRLIWLERNDRYYGDRPAIKNIVGYMVADKRAELDLFTAGKLDLVRQVPPSELPLWKGKPEFLAAPSFWLAYLAFNVGKAPTNLLPLRQAIAHAIDRNEIARVLSGLPQPLASWIPDGMFGYEPARGLSFDLAKAKSLLRAAGFVEGAQAPPVEMTYYAGAVRQLVMENIQAQLKKNLGLNVQIKSEEVGGFLKRLEGDPPPVHFTTWQADYPDPDNFFTIMLAASGNNHSRWRQTRYDQLVEDGAGTADPATRLKIYSEAQKILLEQDAVVMPLFVSPNTYLVSSRLENYPANALDKLLFKKMRLKH